MEKIKISALVVVRNEERNIERCLTSLKFCDEIILVDQESTDKTVDIAKEYTSKIYKNKASGYPEPSRAFAEKKCRGEWIFNIDADEEITPELEKEILRSIKSDKFDAYRIHRNFFFIKKILKHIGSDDYALRLHKKGSLIYTPDLHNGVFPRENIKIGKMKNSLNHYSTVSAEQHLEKIDRYAKALAKNKKYRSFPRKYFGIFYTPIGYFLYYYIYYKGFLDGKEGLHFSILAFYNEILIYKYVWFD